MHQIAFSLNTVYLLPGHAKAPLVSALKPLSSSGSKRLSHYIHSLYGIMVLFVRSLHSLAVTQLPRDGAQYFPPSQAESAAVN